MGVRPSRIIQHAQATWSKEIELLSADDSIQSIGLPAVRSLLRELPEDGADTRSSKYKVYSATPRIGLDILSRVYSSIDTLSERAERGSTKTAPRRLREAADLNNTVLLPMLGITVSPADVVKARISSEASINACSDAESYFGKAVLQAYCDQGYGQTRISVYHTPEGRPLAFRKKQEESSALTLVPMMTIAGTIIPPGAIVGIDALMTSPTKMTGFHKRDHDALSTYAVGGSFAISPARLSASAFDSQLDKALFAVSGSLENPSVNPILLRSTEQNSIASFTNAALHIMELCEVV
jgi:hypothetical protein